MDYIKISRERMIGEDPLYAEQVVSCLELEESVLGDGGLLSAINTKLGKKLDEAERKLQEAHP